MGKTRQTVGYLRVSTTDQDLEKFKADILKFANDRDFGRVTFVEEKISGLKSWRKRKLNDLVNDMTAGDVLIVPELSRLGRSLRDVLDVLNELTEQEVNVYSVKENFQINGDDIQSKVMRTMFGLFGEIERDLISMRTREGLKAARAQGKILGRPPGPGKSKLDQHRPEIVALLKTGSTKKYVAARFKTSAPNLWNWMRKNKIDIQPDIEYSVESGAAKS